VNATERADLGLFQGFGIELEYMIVDARTLSVLPISDQVIKTIAGEFVNEVEVGELAWSNELVLHVIELKTNGPAEALSPLPSLFQRDVERINQILTAHGGRLMPTGMHPWMDPERETHLWPHEYNPIYETFDRIFGCRGHGWSNLQSMHINLPFANDREFARLHAAVRLLLPIMPALAASSPILEGRVTGALDNRLEAYRNNARRIPSVSGQVIPEAVFSYRDYQTGILERIYGDMALHDPEGILRYEWVNARGAIARFERNTIEIRVLDVQECPEADLAVAAAIVETIRALTEECWSDLPRQQDWEIAPLSEIYARTVTEAEQGVIDDRRYLEVFGFPERGKCRAGELWQHVIETLNSVHPEAMKPWRTPLEHILSQGTLARRILKKVETHPTHDRIKDVFQEVCDCLSSGRLFDAAVARPLGASSA